MNNPINNFADKVMDAATKNPVEPYWENKNIMNRLIKFRAWDKELKQFDNIVAGNLLYSIHDEGLTEEDKHRFILSEFTGLYDINNKEIFEGDIVEIFQEKHLVNQFGFFNLVTNSPGLYLGEYVKLKNLLEVVGNIFENPELL